MKLQSLLKLIRSDEALNIYDVINNVYLHKDIFKEECDDKYNTYKVIAIMTNTNDTGNSIIIEIDVADSNDLFVGRRQ